MTDSKSDRLGLRGNIAIFDSSLRLLGGANATGAIASGVAYHAFNSITQIQILIKVGGILFLFGVFTFALAYTFLVVATIDIDRSLRVEEKEGPEHEFFPTNLTAKTYQKTAKVTHGLAALLGVVSLGLFLLGLVQYLFLALRL
jgi:hypothetical protein